jgi:hypothetical protein
LRKAALNLGVIDEAANAPSNATLRASTTLFAQNQNDRSGGAPMAGPWHHLRLDMVVNLSGDVILKVFQNDVTANPIGSLPVWQTIPGMADFTDDALTINTGSAPYINGRGGFGFRCVQGTLRSYFDQFTLARQL